jgi:hypothetical protein
VNERLSVPQRVAFQMVVDGRVAYGDAYPSRTRRTARRLRGTTGRDLTGHEVRRPDSIRAYATLSWLIDGHEAYGQASRTFSSLEEAGRIVVRPQRMTTHELAELLLTLADVPVVSFDSFDDYDVPVEVSDVTITTGPYYPSGLRRMRTGEVAFLEATTSDTDREASHG